MNILDIVKGALGMDVFLGVLPDKPDALVALFEYSLPPEQYFDRTGFVFGVQARTRAFEPTEAFALAAQIQSKLNRYSDRQIAILQTTAILDIGQDDKKRREYTINFRVNYKE